MFIFSSFSQLKIIYWHP